MSTLRVKRKPVAWLSASLMLLASMISATAAADAGNDQWEYEAMIYLWGGGIDAATQTGGDIDISFSDILDNLDMTLMGDSDSSEQLVAFIETEPGKKYNWTSGVIKGVKSYTKAYSKWAYTKQAMDSWAHLLRGRLDAAHGVTDKK